MHGHACVHVCVHRSNIWTVAQNSRVAVQYLDAAFQNENDKETRAQLDLTPKTTYFRRSSSWLSRRVAGQSAREGQRVDFQPACEQEGGSVFGEMGDFL